MEYIVYILRTDKGTLYTGLTNNLKKRLSMHRSGKGAKYLRQFAFFEVVYQENVPNKSLALKRELEIKKMPKKEKELLVGSS